MHTLKNQSGPNAFKKFLGYTAVLTILAQLIVPGFFGVGTVDANSTTTSTTSTSTLHHDHKVDICHATGSGNWIHISVDKSAVKAHIDNHGDFYYTGPHWFSKKLKDKWCDDHAPKPKKASLTVTKVVVGGTSTVANFPLFVNGLPITSGVATTTLGAGTFTITETNQPGYTASFSGSCNSSGQVTLALGQTKSCTITNTFATSSATSTATTTSLTVNKIVSGGNKVASDFALFVNGMPITNGVATTTLGVGNFTVTETNDPNYTRTFSGACNSSGQVSLAAGESKTCTITNTFNFSTSTGTTTTTTQEGSSRVENNINVTAEGGAGGNATATGGNVTIVLGTTTPVFFGGQVLGTTSTVPPTFTGQVLGAQSVPGFPSTGGIPGDLTASENRMSLITMAILLGLIGAAGFGLTMMVTSRRISGKSGGDL